MRATSFEYRYQTLLHLLLIGVALLAYVINPDDVVWALVRHHSNRALLERIVFGSGALIILSSALLETWAVAYSHPGVKSVEPLLTCDRPYRYVQYPLGLSRLLLAIALGLLIPLSGAIILVIGETVLVLRLVIHDDESVTAEHLQRYRFRVPRLLPSRQSRFPHCGAEGKWGEGFRRAASKWGLGASMIVFSLTLQDRIAEIGSVLSFLTWLALNRLSSNSPSSQ